ncbi:PWWP domain-containing protein 5-like [Diospyros lotus]|uniref:PWWP domain-containing protein 5-like n=1 Tax=Diospyros lotus TaxID=55363 RepID=UPI00225A4F34|nr:PWWP domain-containing protein 5-like [Diospyros lotus]
MSVRFDDVDLNSAVDPLERNDESRRANLPASPTFETLTEGLPGPGRVDGGLGSVDGGKKSGIAERGYVNEGNDARFVDMSDGGEIGGNDGGVVSEEHSKDIEQIPDVEKVGQFQVSDLVWGKVRGHPWWPGQIFDPSDSSEKAARYWKKDSFLVAYFGDQTFAWNDASRVRPFRTYFEQMEKQSTSETFCHAVDGALDEVSRRVEFGLACTCLSEELYGKIKIQVIDNDGIHRETRERDGRDEYSSAASFSPLNFLQYLKALAQSPHGRTGRLEFAIARAQLLSFNCWKGYPPSKMLDNLWEDESHIPVTEEIIGSEGEIEDEFCIPMGVDQILLGKEKALVQNNSSRKCKNISGSSLSPRQKERRLSDLMSQGCSYLANEENRTGAIPRRKMDSSSVKKRKTGDSLSDGSNVKTKNASVPQVTRKQFSGVENDSKGNIGEKGGKNQYFLTRSGRLQRRKILVGEYPSADEMLSQIYMAARDPSKGYSLLISTASFFSDYRDSFCLERSTSSADKISTGKASGEQTCRRSSNLGTAKTSDFEGIEDSYWTDRIIQSNPEEQVLFEPETLTKNGALAVEPHYSPELGCKQETGHLNSQSEANSAVYVEPKLEEEYTPTALILNFTDLDSVPSASYLNNVFNCYGPLDESDTEVLENSKRAKVVFKRRSDAENAFCSTGKFSIFGPSLVSYRLNYLPS